MEVSYVALPSSYLDMIFVESFNHWVGEEPIIGCNVLTLIPGPFHILLLPSKVVVVVHQAQYKADLVLSGLGYNKIQPLHITSR